MTAGGAENSQQCHMYIRQYSKFPSENIRFEHGGANLASRPGRHLTLLCPWSSPPTIRAFNCILTVI